MELPAETLKAIQSPACAGFGIGSPTPLEKGERVTIADIEWEVRVIFNPPCCPDADTVYLVRRGNLGPSPVVSEWTAVPCSECGGTYTIQHAYEA